jgi:hypothetical protein
MRTIFDAGPQRKMVWFATLVTLGTGGALIWLGEWLIRTYGLNAAEGGVLKPLAQRILLGGSFVAFGAACIIGILIYLWCYVSRIEADDAGDAFRITVLWPFGWRQRVVGPDDVARASYNIGIFMNVDAPWSSLRLRGRRLPFIIDEQGDFHDEHAVDRLLYGPPAAVEERKPTRKFQKQLARQRRRR